MYSKNGTYINVNDLIKYWAIDPHTGTGYEIFGIVRDRIYDLDMVSVEFLDLPGEDMVPIDNEGITYLFAVDVDYVIKDF